MKLREIEVGMTIHCKTQDQAFDLARYGGLSYEMADTFWNEYKSDTCYYRERNGWSYCDKDYFIDNGYKIIEFEDLIINEFETFFRPTEPVLKDYHITCELTSGEVMNFGGMCNYIESPDFNKDLVTFITKNEKLGYGLVLSVIPTSRIKRINYVNSREQINKVLEGIND